jgi:hypothetical protein
MDKKEEPITWLLLFSKNSRGDISAKTRRIYISYNEKEIYNGQT